MTVYADILFGINTAINYLLLRGSAAMGGCPAKRLRLLAAACLGGFYAVAAVIPGLEWLGSTFFQLLCAAMMVLAAFGPKKCAVKQALFFLALSFAFGGAVLLAVQAAEPDVLLLEGRAYYAVSTPALLLLAAALYGLAAVVLRGWGTHTGGEIEALTLHLEGRTQSVKALQDTGNTLRDPVSGESVLIVDWTVLAALLPTDSLTQTRFRDPAGLLAALSACHPRCRFRLIPYRAVGVDSGLLLAVRCGVSRKNNVPKDALVAFSPTAVASDGRFDALTGGSLI
jgi:stage II sporulation protein GA (sporulation sigma-E factor processing peptidase)